MKFHSHISIAASRSQRGAVLVVSLIVLLVLTILAVSMSQTARLQERMTGNMRDADLAFQSAESALRGAETKISSYNTNPNTCAAPKDDANCDIFETLSLKTIDLRTDKSFWEANGIEYGVIGKQEIGDVESDPGFVIEFVEFVADEPGALPPDLSKGRSFYEITSRSPGKVTTTQAVLQSTYAERY